MEERFCIRFCVRILTQKLNGLLESAGGDLLVVLEVYRRLVTLDSTQRPLRIGTAERWAALECAVGLVAGNAAVLR